MENKDAIIKRLTEENLLLKEQIKVMAAYIKQLEERIAQLEKNSDNSSKPPSSDQNKPIRVAVRSKVKRKQGGQPGHKKHTRTPFAAEQVDKVYEYTLKGKDALGLEPLDDWHIVQQITLPKKLYYVTEHRARKYLNPQTNKIVIAPLPADIIKGGLFGADITALTAFLKGDGHMSITTIQTFFAEFMGIKVSRGLLCKKINSVSVALGQAYYKLLARLPQEKVIGIDETGHKDNGKKHWTWCFQTPSFSLFHIDQSRGSKVLFDILGYDFAGLINCDYFGAYRKYFRMTESIIQFCLAHLIREIRFIAELTCQTARKWAKDLLKLLKELFKTRYKTEKYTSAGLIQKMERIKARFLDKVRRPPDNKFATKLCRRFVAGDAENYFRFVNDPEIEPTNNGTEREIRHTVIDRRITYGTRGSAGMRWCERIWTTIATCKKQKRNVLEFIHNTIIAHWNGMEHPKLV
jgi:transposase